MLPLLLPLAIEAAKGIYGAFQSNKASDALGKINTQPREPFQTGEQIYNRAKGLATGMTPEQWGRGMNQLTQLGNTRYKLGVERNPNLAGAVQAGVNYGNTEGVIGLAGKDADIYQGNLRPLTGLIGGQANLQTRSDLSYRDKMEQTYGQANVAGIKNIFGAAEGAGGMVYNKMLNDQWVDMARKGVYVPRMNGGGRTTSQYAPNTVGSYMNEDGSFNG